MYSCTSRSVGLAGERQLPQAVEGEALAALFQMISPRMRKPIFGHILHDRGMERDIGFAPQVGNVDAGPAARHQDPVDLLPDPAQESRDILPESNPRRSLCPRYTAGEVTIRWTLWSGSSAMASEDFAKIVFRIFRRHRIFNILADPGRGDLGVEFAGIEGRGIVGDAAPGCRRRWCGSSFWRDYFSSMR